MKACTNCSNAKTRCDRKRPVCTRCQKRKSTDPCVYIESPTGCMKPSVLSGQGAGSCTWEYQLLKCEGDSSMHTPALGTTADLPDDLIPPRPVFELTQKFMDVLFKSTNDDLARIDLDAVCGAFDVSSDALNPIIDTFEALNLIKRHEGRSLKVTDTYHQHFSSNKPGYQKSKLAEKKQDLNHQVQQMELEHQHLDRELCKLQAELRSTAVMAHESKSAYVTAEDLVQSLMGCSEKFASVAVANSLTEDFGYLSPATLIALHAPPGTVCEVPHPDDGRDLEELNRLGPNIFTTANTIIVNRRFQLFVHSAAGALSPTLIRATPRSPVPSPSPQTKALQPQVQPSSLTPARLFPTVPSASSLPAAQAIEQPISSTSLCLSEERKEMDAEAPTKLEDSTLPILPDPSSSSNEQKEQEAQKNVPAALPSESESLKKDIAKPPGTTQSEESQSLAPELIACKSEAATNNCLDAQSEVEHASRNSSPVRVCMQSDVTGTPKTSPSPAAPALQPDWEGGIGRLGLKRRRQEGASLSRGRSLGWGWACECTLLVPEELGPDYYHLKTVWEDVSGADLSSNPVPMTPTPPSQKSLGMHLPNSGPGLGQQASPFTPRPSPSSQLPFPPSGHAAQIPPNLGPYGARSQIGQPPPANRPPPSQTFQPLVSHQNTGMGASTSGFAHPMPPGYFSDIQQNRHPRPTSRIPGFSPQMSHSPRGLPGYPLPSYQPHSTFPNYPAPPHNSGFYRPPMPIPPGMQGYGPASMDAYLFPHDYPFRPQSSSNSYLGPPYTSSSAYFSQPGQGSGLYHSNSSQANHFSSSQPHNFPHNQHGGQTRPPAAYQSPFPPSSSDPPEIRGPTSHPSALFSVTPSSTCNAPPPPSTMPTCSTRPPGSGSNSPVPTGSVANTPSHSNKRQTSPHSHRELPTSALTRGTTSAPPTSSIERPLMPNSQISEPPCSSLPFEGLPGPPIATKQKMATSPVCASNTVPNVSLTQPPVPSVLTGNPSTNTATAPSNDLSSVMDDLDPMSLLASQEGELSESEKKGELWIEYHCAESNRPVYHNPLTGVLLWELPTQLDPPIIVKSTSHQYHNKCPVCKCVFHKKGYLKHYNNCRFKNKYQPEFRDLPELRTKRNLHQEALTANKRMKNAAKEFYLLNLTQNDESSVADADEGQTPEDSSFIEKTAKWDGRPQYDESDPIETKECNADCS